ncbi:MAG: RNA methyltransferase, partial [Planctomycetota bacterium]|nr:RNA methyltransferase [Planctomycetota bacterium]
PGFTPTGPNSCESGYKSMTEIKSLQNERVKAVVRLRDGRHRQKQGRFLIDGLRELSRTFDTDITIREVFYCRTLCTVNQLQRLDVLLADMDDAADFDDEDAVHGSEQIKLIAVSKAVFKKMAFGDRAEGILAVAETPDRKLSDLWLPKNTLIAVIVGIEKPGNIGAVIRSADAASVDAVILADCRTDLFNPNAIRASLGTILTLPVCQATTTETIAWLRERGLTIFAARVDGSVPYDQADFSAGGAIVLGSEAQGLSDAWAGDDVRAIRLPMHGIADSLNISATAAVLFYEALRQRS